MDTKKILELFNTALAYKNKGEFEQAAVYYEEVLKITDQLPEVYFNLAFVYIDLDRQQEAIQCLNKFLTMEPNDTEALFFLGSAYFKTKDYEKGYPYFEYRISRSHAIQSQIKLYGERFNKIPFWQGEDLTDKTIYVYYEAGLGDTLMYYRYIKPLAQRCKKVYFKPQIPLIPLFSENRNGAKIIMHFNQEIADECDYQCPIMSLPYFLRLDNKTVFYDSKGFLKAVPKKVEWYKEKFFNNNKLKIGIKWQGNTFIGAERAVTPDSFAKIFELPNTQVYSVQVTNDEEEVKTLQGKYNIVDIASTFKDFSCTAAAMENLDIIICNDTSVGHLAGAMGKKCYMILPKYYDWRWHTNISKCDWYDSIKLYRQKTTWEEVIGRIYEDIRQSSIL
ncbi:tetratricopeptide repeat protein [bacterium]|nr:tetratricopeptide repeat protein [bacterium]